MVNRKTALIFPGQGSQFVGMGSDFYSEIPQAKEIFEAADKILSFSLSSIILKGPEEKLNETSICQPAVLSVSFCAFKIFMNEITRRNISLQINAALGHSLGEYTALTATGVLDFHESVLLVHKRGKFMEEVKNGGMAAIIGLSLEEVKEIINKLKGVEIANLNCPGQTVIAGNLTSLEQVMKRAKEKGAKMVLKLKVSIPSHSSYMKDAKEKLKMELEKIDFKKPSFPIIPNYSAELTEEPSTLKQALIEQMTNTVKWEESIRKAINSGINTFIEIGPGKVLSGLVKRINPEVEIFMVSDLETLEQTLQVLK
jgi:[acyl-carrier-protein] S-malonyltransferase